MLTRKQKEDLVGALSADLGAFKKVFFIDYKGVNTKAMQTLRAKIKEADGNLRIIKKTLLKRALSSAGFDKTPADFMEGQIAFVSGDFEPVSIAKALSEFRKTIELEKGVQNTFFSVRGGWFGGEALTALQLAQMAKLSSREELLAKLAGVLAGPIRGFLSVLNGPQRGLVLALNEISRKNS